MKNTSIKDYFTKIYLQTWFIGFVFSFTFLHWFFFIVGLFLIIIQYFFFKTFIDKYGKCEDLEQTIENLEQKKEDCERNLEAELSKKKEELNNYILHMEKESNIKETELKNKSKDLTAEIQNLRAELLALESDCIASHYQFSDYDGLSSEDCKNKLALLKNDEQALIKSGKAFYIQSNEAKKIINDNTKQILRCFNSECDNILLNISTKNIDNMRSKVTKSFESLNKIFIVDGISLEKSLLELKLEELNLVYTYEVKREQERELQKAIKEQMIEEEKIRREIETQKAKIEKDQLQCSKEINKLMSYMQKSQNDIEKQLYIDKIKELEDRLKELEESKETVLERESNAKAGFVYIISNIGSFGEDVYKIGMTRRLEPMDRIKELSSASVPFEFDVHAMIFANDAPMLENTLHHHFEKKNVNRVNPRKEFFKVSLEEIEQVVKDNFNNTVEFTRIPVAKEYRQTLNILKSENVS